MIVLKARLEAAVQAKARGEDPRVPVGDIKQIVAVLQKERKELDDQDKLDAQGSSAVGEGIGQESKPNTGGVETSQEGGVRTITGAAPEAASVAVAEKPHEERDHHSGKRGRDGGRGGGGRGGGGRGRGRDDDEDSGGGEEDAADDEPGEFDDEEEDGLPTDTGPKCDDGGAEDGGPKEARTGQDNILRWQEVWILITIWLQM